MGKNIAKYGGLPVYKITVDETVEGMTKVSLVDYPAVEVDFITLKREARPQLYAVQDEEKRLVRGVLLRADFPIYRRDPETGEEYYIVFERETIRAMAEQYLTDGNANAVNQMHEAGSDVTGVNLVQWFIKDAAAGVQPAGFEDIEEGSLFAEYHVTNDAVWDRIKDGTFKGFSIECTTYVEPVPAGESTIEEDALLALISKYKYMPNLIAKLKAAFNEVVAQHFRTDTTDKGVIAWDGDEAIKVGDAVQTVAEDDTRATAPDGDYTLSDGTVVTIADGVVTEVKEPEQDPDPAAADPDPATQTATRSERLRKIAQTFAESYDEKIAKIAAAISAAGYPRGNDVYGYVWEAGDDYAIFCYYGEDTAWQDKFLKFPVSWNEAGDAVVGEPEEVKRSFVPVNDPAPAAGEPGPASAAEGDTLAALREDVNTLCTVVTGLCELLKPAAPQGQELNEQKPAATPAGTPAAQAFKEAKEKDGKTDTPDAVTKLRKMLGNR